MPLDRHRYDAKKKNDHNKCYVIATNYILAYQAKVFTRDGQVTGLNSILLNQNWWESLIY